MADHPSQIQLQPEKKQDLAKNPKLFSEIRRMIYGFAADEATKIFYVNDAQDTSIFLSNNEVGGIVRNKNTHNWPNTFELPHLRRLDTLKKKDLLFPLLHVETTAREVAWKAYIKVISNAGFLEHFFKLLYFQRYHLSKSACNFEDGLSEMLGDMKQVMENIQSRILINPGVGYDWTNNGALRLLTDVHETLECRLMDVPGSSSWSLHLAPGAGKTKKMDEERGPFRSLVILPQPSPEPKLWELKKDAFEPTFIRGMTAYLDTFDIKYIVGKHVLDMTEILESRD
ncbi:hypothetical protein ACHAQE_000105 [Botrytis cinerea]